MSENDSFPDYLRRNLKRLTDQYERSRQEVVPGMDKLLGWLNTNVDQVLEVGGVESTIVHGDFR